MLITRALAALVFAPPLLYLVWRGGLPLEVTCLVLAGVVLWEYVELTLGPGEAYLKIVTYALGAAVALVALSWVPAPMAAVLLPVGVLFLFTAMLMRPDPLPQSMARAGLVAVGALYGGGLIPYLARLRDLPATGLGLAVMALFCTWGADTGAYFAGRLFGRHKLYPKISPGKTVEGVFGGLAAGIGVAFLVRWLFGTELGHGHLVAIGSIAALLGLAGDLSESMLKRSVGAKDSSKLIPGHGGVLDRFDGVIFAAPAIYVYVTLVLA